MGKHQFGGDWTTDKLERVREYLTQYAKIFTANRKARHYTTTYVDAFAGTGHRVDTHVGGRAGSGLFGEAIDEDVESFKEGSALMALRVEPPFRRYVFIEHKPERVADLERLRTGVSASNANIDIVCAEANGFLLEWCETTDWQTHRAVVFLDPYGMQVDWATVEAIARTKAVDLWYLFPLSAVNRLLTRADSPPTAWADRLTRTLGTADWREQFYAASESQTLFGPELIEQRDADFGRISEFFVRLLRAVFAGVADKPLVLRNSRNSPLYLLCFAAGNERGAPTAVKIARHILGT